MAITMKQMSLIVGTLGTLSFIFGVIAENKKVLAIFFSFLFFVSEILITVFD